MLTSDNDIGGPTVVLVEDSIYLVFLVAISSEKLLGSLEVTVHLLTIGDQLKRVGSNGHIVESFLGFSQSFHGIFQVVPNRLHLAVDSIIVLDLDLAVVFTIAVLKNVELLLLLTSTKISHQINI